MKELIKELGKMTLLVVVVTIIIVGIFNVPSDDSRKVILSNDSHRVQQLCAKLCKQKFNAELDSVSQETGICNCK